MTTVGEKVHLLLSQADGSLYSIGSVQFGFRPVTNTAFSKQPDFVNTAGDSFRTCAEPADLLERLFASTTNDLERLEFERALIDAVSHPR